MFLDRIQTKIGDTLHLPRERLIQQAVEAMQVAQVVLITGPAGSGKSVVAKEFMRVVGDDAVAVSFRAEEFARAHLDETLHQAQIPMNAESLATSLAGHSRKIVHVESVERLLEHSVRDAFGDLMMLASRDSGWRIVLTCRDYGGWCRQCPHLEAGPCRCARPASRRR